MDDSQDIELQAHLRRHLVKEARLAADVENLNRKTAEALAAGGLRGPSQKQLQAVEHLVSKIQNSISGIKRDRRVLLQQIHSMTSKKFDSLREYIRALPDGARESLERSRISVLKTAANAQAGLLHNQTSLFYTMDFHRRYLAALVPGEQPSQSYRPDGRTEEIAPGNLFGKAC